VLILQKIISGLDKAGVKLSEFSKVCKKQFSCGASVVTVGTWVDWISWWIIIVVFL